MKEDKYTLRADYSAMGGLFIKMQHLEKQHIPFITYCDPDTGTYYIKWSPPQEEVSNGK